MDFESEAYQFSEQRIRYKNRSLSSKKIQDQLTKQKPKLIKNFSRHSAIEKNIYLERISQSQSSEGDPSAEFKDVNSFLNSSDSSSSENSSQSLKSRLSKSTHRRIKSRNSQYLPELNEDMQEIIDQYQFVVDQAQVQFNCYPNKEVKKLIVDKLVEKHIDQSIEDNNYINSDYHSKSALDHSSHQQIDKSSQDHYNECSHDQIKILNENDDLGSTKTKPYPKLSYQELQTYFDLIQNTTFQHKFKKQFLNKTIDSKLDQSLTSSQSSGSSNQSRIQSRHSKFIQRNAEQDQYSIRLTRLRGLNKYKYIYENYTDEYPLLAFRQIFYLIVSFMKTSIKIFMKSLIYQIFLTLVLLLNTIAYMIAQLQDPNQNILDIKQFILSFYIVDLVFQLIAFGFLKSKALYLSRSYDITLIIFYQLYLQGRIGVDITPFRIIRLLGSLGEIFPGLNKMLNGLIVALMYMAESIIFTLLTSILFASISVSLFHGFFNNRCDYNDESWIQCVQGYCEQGTCIYNETSADPTSTFNNIIYSFGQILRTVTMDGYTYTMYYMMRSFHNYVCVLFMVIIFIGGFFNFNLPIAVFKVYFSQHNSDLVNQNLEQKKNIQSFKLNLIRELGLLDQVKQLLQFPYKKASGDHSLIVPFSIMRINTNSTQNPRILGGLHEVEENTIQSKLKKIQEKLQTINIFQLILPKYQQLSNYYHKNQLDSKLKQILSKNKFQNDLLILFEPPNILALSVDFTTEYKSSSQLVILKNRMYIILLIRFPIIERNRNLRQNLNMKKKLYYKNKFIQDTLRQQTFKSFKLPILRVQRLQGIKSMDISKLGNSQSNLSIDLKDLKYINSQNDQPRKSLHSSTILLKDAQPFVKYSIKDEEFQVFIHEKYVNYNQLSALINQDVKSLVPQKEQLQFELKYYQILKKEQDRKILKTKLWSGKNILLKEQKNIKSIFDSLNYKDINIWLMKFSGLYIISRKYAHQIINKPLGRFIFDICILVNTTAVALQGIISRDLIDQIEDVTLFVLLFEVLVYIHVYAFKRLQKNIEFLIELLIVTTCFIEFIFSEQLHLSTPSLRALRATKCLLFYRCIRYLQISRVIWVIFKITYQSTIHLIFLMFFTVFIFSLVGIQIYSHQFDAEQKAGYLSSFDDPLKGVMTVFDNMTNDDWYTIFSNGSKVNRIYAAFFSYTQVLVLNYFVFGIFMAISLDGFSQYLDQEENNLDNQFLMNKLRSIRKFNKKLKDQVEQYQSSDESEQSSLSSNSSSEADIDNQNIPLSIQVQQATQLQQQTIFKRNNVVNPIIKATTRQSQQQEFISNLKAEQSNLRKNINIQNIKQQPSRFLQYLQESIKIIQKDVLKSNTKPYSSITCSASFFLFDKSNIARKYLYKLLNNQLYTYVWLIILIYQLFLLTNTQEYSSFDSWIQILINTLLLMDKVVKSILYGFCYDEGSLMNTTIWEIIDLVYIIVYFIYILSISQAPLFRVLQILIYFRPILMLYQIDWIKSITVALGQSVYDILNVLLFILLLWLIFAIFGIIIFSDKFGYCSFSYNYLVNKEQCMSENLIWYNYKHNFDNITVALPALFVISTFDGLAEPLWIMQNSQFSQLGPEPYTNQLNTYVYIISFCTIGAFILLNIFTGVLFINLKANSKALQDIKFTESQQEFITVGNIIIRTTYNQSVYKNAHAKRITDSKLIQLFVYCIVVINAVKKLSMIISILMVWSILRYLSKGQKIYIENFWDRLYTLVVIFGFIDLILDIKISWFYEFTISDQTTEYYHLYRIIHMVRNIRMLGVFEGLPKVCRMVRVMSFSFNYFFQIIFLFFIMMITYAYFGVYFFSHIDKGLVINDLINFRNFWLSLITLFKCASGDDFRSVMNDCMQHNPYCQTDEKYCGSPWAQVYFFSFMIISNNILINLFILGLIERFELFFNNTDSILQTYVEQIDNMKVIWEQYSRNNDFHMNVRYLAHFLVKIGEPLGCKSYENLWDASKLAGSFKLKCDLQNQIAQNQLFYELFRKRYKANVLNIGTEEVIERMRIFDKQMKFRLFYYRVSTRHKRNNIGPQLQMKGNTNVLHEMFAALLCFKTWQKYTEELIQNIMTNKAAEFSRKSIESLDVPIISKHQISINDSDAQLPEQPQYQRVQSRNKKKVSIFMQQVEYRENELLKPVNRMVISDQIDSINTENPIQQIKSEISQSKHKRS